LPRIVYQIVLHVVFWAACYFIAFRLFTKDYNNGTIDYIYTGLFIAPMMIIVYLNQGLLNYSIRHRRFWIYLVGIPLLLVLGVALHFFSFDQLSDLLFPEYYLTSYYSIWEVTQYCAIFLIVTSLLKLAQDWFQIKDREIRLIKENHQAQLSSLKSQINPHFLFNSLNNIYAISVDDPDAVRKYIVKLSDALRYMIYETDEKVAPLQEEINYLKDYIGLEQLRMNDPNSVQFSYPENTSELIAPLILLPIVENCFKHCNKQSPDIEIYIELKDTNLQLIASNSIVKSDKSNQNSGGLGLENLEKRLNLLYPERHKLTVQVAHERYRTTLMIDLRV